MHSALASLFDVAAGRYNATISGPSGNITVNGTLTYGAQESTTNTMVRRGVGAGEQTGVDLNSPPYAIHNGKATIRSLLDRCLTYY